MSNMSDLFLFFSGHRVYVIKTMYCFWLYNFPATWYYNNGFDPAKASKDYCVDTTTMVALIHVIIPAPTAYDDSESREFCRIIERNGTFRLSNDDGIRSVRTKSIGLIWTFRRIRYYSRDLFIPRGTKMQHLYKKSLLIAFCFSHKKTLSYVC